MSSHRRFAARIGVLVVLVIAAGCGEAGPSSDGAVASHAPSVKGTAPILSQRELSEAIAFRQRFGLRADETWVRAVAADPVAQIGVRDFGLPLLPEEFDDLKSRTWDPDLFEHVRAYGLLFPDDYGGARINVEGSGVVIYFADRIDRHRAALSNLTPFGSKVEVREVEWTLAELIHFKEAVLTEQAWFESVGVVAKAGEDIADNAVHLRYQGPEAAAALIEEHFGHPTWLRAHWLGPLPWEGPRADLTIKVVDPNGAPVAELRCHATPVDPAVDPGPDAVWGTDNDGLCVIDDLPTVEFEVTLHEMTSAGLDLDPVKTFRVAVEPGGTSITVIALPTDRTRSSEAAGCLDRCDHDPDPGSAHAHR